MAGLEMKRGVKRKHDQLKQEQDISERIRAKLHHGIKEVKKASKKIKTFEIQKVVKKLKEARNKNNDESVKELEAQLECLKHIDHDLIGVRALCSKINKDFVLSKNSECQTALSKEVPPIDKDLLDPSPHYMAVLNRLLSSKVLAQEISEIIQSLKVLLGVQKKTESINMSENEKGGGKERRGESAIGEMRKRKVNTESNASDNEREHGGSEAWAGFSRDGTESFDIKPGIEKQLISNSYPSHASDDDDIDEDEDEQDDGEEQISRNRSSIALDENDTDGDESEGSTGPPLSNEAVDLINLPPKARAGESTFLPSLSVGFIRGNSDSDWSDGEADIADIPQRKNRRGQRARKAIWEKKYGRNANHLKKLRDAEPHNNPGRFDSRGWGRGQGTTGTQKAQNSDESNQNRGRGRSIPSAAEGQPVKFKRFESESSYNAKPVAQLKSREEMALHPSWEAKKKLKEKQNPAIVPSQGTRIKFD